MDMPDRFGTTTRRASGNDGGHYTALNEANGVHQEPVAAKRQTVSEVMAAAPRNNVNENNYIYDTMYQQQQSQQPRKHLEDVTNYEPQAMHNLSYGSSPSDYSPAGVLGHEGDGGPSSSSGGGMRTGYSEGIAKPIIIANSSNDPETVDEMEKRKERIMLMSLQRRQQQEEAKAMKEANTMRRREKEQMKEEEKARKKEEMAARRQAILEAHKLKKAIEEAEREGKVIDKNDLMLLKQTQQQLQINSSTVRRPQKTVRPRPKTIHVDSGSVDLSEASSIASNRTKKGSNSNLAGECRGFEHCELFLIVVIL